MPPGSTSPWTNPRIVFTLALVFLTGAAAGGLGMRYGMKVVSAQNGPSWKESGKEVTLQMFRKELKLSDAQAAEVETVLDDFMMYYQTLQAQMDEVRGSGKERILKILNEEQKAKFNRVMGDLQSKQIR